MKAPTMHNDEPTLLDRLNRRGLITEVGDAIANCSPPLVFGVHGDWGLGKTSFLHQVQWYLTGNCPQQYDATKRSLPETSILGEPTGLYKRTIRAIWFDAWRYQHETAPIVALLQEMRTQLSWVQRAATATARGSEVSVRGALLSIEELTKKIGLQYSKFLDANREWEAKNLAVALPSHTLRVHLSKAISTLLPRRVKNAPSPRLAVFIDDLDRCEPEAAYRLLEGLKIYLALDNCVFVLGMNQKAVEGAIGGRMDARQDHAVIVSAASEEHQADHDLQRQVRRQIERQVKSRATAYLEKLCQNIWRLPTVRDPGRLLNDLLESTVESASVRDRVKQAIEGCSCLPPNPRRIKGLANLLGRLSSRLPPDRRLRREAAIIEARLLVIVAYVYQFHHELFVRWESDPSFYNKIRDRCQGQESDISCLDSLVLRERSPRDDKAPTPTSERESTYPDPTDPNVFWIQPLVDSLGTEVTAEQFRPYLHGGTT